MLLKQHDTQQNANSKEIKGFSMSLIEFIHNLVAFCEGHVAPLQWAVDL